jgi:ribosome-binding factor A
MKDVRLNRLTQLVHRRASEIVLYDLKDPRLGLVTVTRVKLARDLKHAIIFYSVIGSDADRSKTQHALESARGHVQSQIAATMRTRVTPIIRFEYDESVEGAVRVSRILEEIRRDRPEEAEPSGAADEEE